MMTQSACLLVAVVVLVQSYFGVQAAELEVATREPARGGLLSSSQAGRLRGRTTVTNETAAVYEELYLSYQAPDEGMYGDAVGVRAQAKPEELYLSYQAPDEGMYGDAVGVQAQAKPKVIAFPIHEPMRGGPFVLQARHLRGTSATFATSAPTETNMPPSPPPHFRRGF
jgi:hypothetical protein